MKKIFILFISLALILVSIYFLPTKQTDIINAGEGNEVNAKITSIEEFKVLLDFIVESRNEASQLAFPLDSINIIERGTVLSKSNAIPRSVSHDSVTVFNDTLIQAKSKILDDYYSSGENVYISRKLFLYLETDATYYNCNLEISSVNTQKTNLTGETSEYLNMTYNAELYICGQISIMKINRWTCNGISIRSQAIGKWIILPEESEFYTVDIDWRQIFKQLNNFITDHEDEIRSNDNVYKISINDTAYQSSNYIIDISNHVNPYVETNSRINQHNERVDLDYQFYNSLDFLNIDNTTICFDTQSPEILSFPSEEEWVRFVFGSEETAEAIAAEANEVLNKWTD